MAWPGMGKAQWRLVCAVLARGGGTREVREQLIERWPDRFGRVTAGQVKKQAVDYLLSHPHCKKQWRDMLAAAKQRAEGELRLEEMGSAGEVLREAVKDLKLVEDVIEKGVTTVMVRTGSGETARVEAMEAPLTASDLAKLLKVRADLLRTIAQLQERMRPRQVEVTGEVSVSGRVDHAHRAVDEARIGRLREKLLGMVKGSAENDNDNSGSRRDAEGAENNNAGDNE